MHELWLYDWFILRSVTSGLMQNDGIPLKGAVMPQQALGKIPGCCSHKDLDQKHLTLHALYSTRHVVSSHAVPFLQQVYEAKRQHVKLTCCY